MKPFRSFLCALVVSVGCGCSSVDKDRDECVEHAPASNYVTQDGQPIPANSPLLSQMTPMGPSPQQLPGYPMPSQGGPAQGAIGLGVVKVPIPVPKLFLVPKPAPAQQPIIIQTPPVMGHGYPGMGYPPGPMGYPVAAMPQPQPAPQPGMSPAEMAMLMKMMQAQQAQQALPAQSAPQASPSAEQQALEERARKLEENIDRLTKTLQQGQ